MAKKQDKISLNQSKQVLYDNLLVLERKYKKIKYEYNKLKSTNTDLKNKIEKLEEMNLSLLEKQTFEKPKLDNNYISNISRKKFKKLINF